MAQLAIHELPQSIIKELKVDAEGKGSITRRGLARLCGRSQTTIQKLLVKLEKCSDSLTLAKSLQPIAGQSFEGEHPLPDYVAAAIKERFHTPRSCGAVSRSNSTGRVLHIPW